jgi:hypothetical protein
MELELFQKTYTPAMMRLVKKLSEMIELEIKEDIQSDNHHVILKAKHKMDDLAEAKMLLGVYEACPTCFQPECTSDHK